MKRSVFLLFAGLLQTLNYAFAQVEPGNRKTGEPGCACDKPVIVADLGGSLKLDYTEIKVCTLDDGSVMLMDRNTGKYYIASAGIMKGPLGPDDPGVAGYSNCYLESKDMNDLLARYKGILTREGDRYKVKIGGKIYGPYVEITDFTATRSRDKFAMVATKNEGEMPSLVTNIPGATLDVVNTPGFSFSGTVKYDDIVVVTNDNVLDLQGRVLFHLKPEMPTEEGMFLSNTGKVFTWYDFGVLNFSDGRKLEGCFNPRLEKSGEVLYLAYMYYSPARRSIMACRIPY